MMHWFRWVWLFVEPCMVTLPSVNCISSCNLGLPNLAVSLHMKALMCTLKKIREPDRGGAILAFSLHVGIIILCWSNFYTKQTSTNLTWWLSEWLHLEVHIVGKSCVSILYNSDEILSSISFKKTRSGFGTTAALISVNNQLKGDYCIRKERVSMELERWGSI